MITKKFIHYRQKFVQRSVTPQMLFISSELNTFRVINETYGLKGLVSPHVRDQELLHVHR